jgi:uncharacterized protein with gpF-like domain
MDREQIRQDFKRFQQRREKIWTVPIKKALQKQVEYFINIYGPRPANTDLIILDIAPVYDVLLNLYIDAGVNWGAKVRSQLTKQMQTKARMPIGFSEELIALIKQYFEIDLLNDVTEISDTTRNELLRVLTRATEIGASLDDTIAMLRDDTITAARARLIARTETVTAANRGAQISAAQTGLLLQKTWIAATDNRTRPDHRDVNGTTIDFDQPFIVGGYKMQQPGDRGTQGNRTPAKEICNCRCTVGYEGKRDANGRLIRVSPPIA